MKGLLRALILLAVRLAGMPRVRAAARQARSTGVAGAPRILLIRPDHLGDLVLTTPVLHALRQRLPGADLTMAAGPWSGEIVARSPDLQRLLVIPFPGFTRAPQKPLVPYILLFRTAKQLRRGRYELAINLRPDFWWGAALLYLAGIPRRVGYALEPSLPFLTHTLPFTAAEHATVSGLRLTSLGLQTLGGEPLPEPFLPEDYPLDFRPLEEEQRQVSDRLRRAGIDETTPIIVIHPGSGAAVKLWRSEGWARIADQLCSRLTISPQARIILTGSKGEQAMLVLGVDNGPLHIAVAQGTPTLQLFGPTDARIFGPWGSLERHRVLASTARCATCPAIPCGRLDFAPEELPAHPCVRKLAEQAVMTAVEPLLPHERSD